jgi:hypothetical protein
MEFSAHISVLSHTSILPNDLTSAFQEKPPANQAPTSIEGKRSQTAGIVWFTSPHKTPQIHCSYFQIDLPHCMLFF